MKAAPGATLPAKSSHLVFDDQVVAVCTSADGGTAHLAEQIANKIGVPILTMSSDPTTTGINLPWIFRLGPTDADQAGALVRDLYRARKFERVALLTRDDHDGRQGGDEFENAARKLDAPPPVRIVVPLEGLAAARRPRPALARAQAVVIWTDAPGATRLVGQVREVLPTVPIYLCHKAVLGDGIRSMCSDPQLNCGDDATIWTSEAPGRRRLRPPLSSTSTCQRFGVKPGLGAAQAYDAVRLLTAALRESGPNRARLRDSWPAFPGSKARPALSRLIMPAITSSPSGSR